MCDCINETTAALQEKIVADVEKKNKINEWLEKGKYQHKSFSMSGGPSKIGMPVIVQYRIEKVNGEPAKNITTQHITVYPTYCPFCGVKYEEV